MWWRLHHVLPALAFVISLAWLGSVVDPNIPFRYFIDRAIELPRSLAVLTIAGAFVLSGYRCDLYDAAARFGWSRVDREIDNKASSKPVKPKKIESYWRNNA